MLEDLIWLQQEQSFLIAVTGLGVKLDGLTDTVTTYGQRAVNAIEQLGALRSVVTPVVIGAVSETQGNAGALPTAWETVKGLKNGIEDFYDFRKKWFGDINKPIWPWLKNIVGNSTVKGLVSAALPAIGTAGLIFGGGYIAQKGLEAITDKELEPEPIPYAVMGPNGLEFVEKEQRKFDWTNPVKSIQEGAFYQWLFGKPEVEQALPPSQTFVDSSAMLGQGMVMAPQQAAANTTIHLTMNNSFAVDREETADYCIRELYRRMRAELDGARLGVAY